MGLSLKGIVGAVAPILGSVIGGPAGALAERLLSKHLLGKEDASVEEIAQAAAAAETNPDVRLKILLAQQEYELKIGQLSLDALRAENEDRANARQREIQTHDPTVRQLTIAFTLGFFAVTILALANGIPKDGHDILVGLIGGLITIEMTIIAYHFGSSVGSRLKDITAALRGEK